MHATQTPAISEYASTFFFPFFFFPFFPIPFIFSMQLLPLLLLDCLNRPFLALYPATSRISKSIQIIYIMILENHSHSFDIGLDSVALKVKNCIPNMHGKQELLMDCYELARRDFSCCMESWHLPPYPTFFILL